MTADRTGRATRTTGSHVAGWLALTLLASGCGGGAPPSPPPASGAPAPGATATAAVKPGPVALPKEPEPGPSLPPLSYDGKGRRDPFAPIVLAKAKDKPGSSILMFKLTGVIQGSTPLALVEANDGIGYVLKRGEHLGDGRVMEITPNTVTFEVAASAGQAATTVMLRLAQD